MYRFYIRHKKIIVFLPFLIFTYAFIYFINYLDLSGNPAIIRQNTFMFFLIRSFSGFLTIESFNMFEIILATLLLLVPLFVFAGEFREDLKISYPYVFTRYGKKVTWLRKRFLALSNKIILFELVRLFIYSILSLIVSKSFYIDLSSAIEFLKCFGLNVLHLLFWVSLENILGVRLDDSISIPIIMSIYITLIIIIANVFSHIPTYLLYILVPANVMYFWHTNINLPEYQAVLKPLDNFFIGYSFIALILLIIIMYLIFDYLLKKLDSMELLGGNL